MNRKLFCWCHFIFIWYFFSSKWEFTYFKIFVKYISRNIPFSKGKSKFTFQFVFENKKYDDFLITLFENSPCFMKYWQLHIFDQSFYVKKANLIEKIPYKIEKNSLIKWFSFLNLHSDLKILSNLIGSWLGYKDFRFWDNIQNLKTRFVFEKYGPK